MKKEYSAPSIRSFQVNVPMAYACNIYNASECCVGGVWSGCNAPTQTNWICD